MMNIDCMILHHKGNTKDITKAHKEISFVLLCAVLYATFVVINTQNSKITLSSKSNV